LSVKKQKNAISDILQED